jgi:hypothetical protein
VHLCKANNFCNLFFLSFDIKNAFSIFQWPEGSEQVLFRELATKGTMQNLTTLIFMGGGPCMSATSRILGII